MRMMPSFRAVMQMDDMKIEVLSLLKPVVRDSSICMTKMEVKYVIQQSGRRPLTETEAVPGREWAEGMFGYVAR